MKILYLILCMLLSGLAVGQVYFDPAVAGAQAAHTAVIEQQLNTTNEKLTLIERGQLAITGNLTIVNSMQEKIFKGLSEVSSILTTLSGVREIVRISQGITSDINDIMQLANEDPVFLVFAEQNATLFQQRATTLALVASNSDIEGGANNLMDSGERSKIITTVLNEMVILRSYTFGLYRAMYFAKMRGFFNSVIPFQSYIE